MPRTRPSAPQPCPGCTAPPRTRSGPERGRRGRRAPGVLTSLSWSREPVASRKLSSSPLRSPPLDTATFIWRQGETGSASTDLTPSHCWRGVGREGAGPGQAPGPRPQTGAELPSHPLAALTGRPGEEAAASSVLLSSSQGVTQGSPGAASRTGHRKASRSLHTRTAGPCSPHRDSRAGGGLRATPPCDRGPSPASLCLGPVPGSPPQGQRPRPGCAVAGLRLFAPRTRARFTEERWRRPVRCPRERPAHISLFTRK